MNKLVQQLSGGNRRKVSLAAALLGNPPAVYLDEPSTGLDPVACRLMWRTIAAIAATRTCAIVLTTHNMAEAEATCSRISIMKMGKMECLGSAAHLRSTHGTGFMFELRVRDDAQVQRASEFVHNTFPNCRVVDEHSTMLNYEVPATDIPRLSEAFATMEANKQELGVIDYSLSQSTLEQVFLKKIKVTESDYLYSQGMATSKNVAAGKALTSAPRAADYWTGYMMWFLALAIPGLHHFWLGNTARGFKYFFTANELMVGWFLDLFEMHMLVRRSVEEFGNKPCCGFCTCCCGYGKDTAADEEQGSGGQVVVESENPAAGADEHKEQS